MSNMQSSHSGEGATAYDWEYGDLDWRRPPDEASHVVVVNKYQYINVEEEDVSSKAPDATRSIP